MSEEKLLATIPFTERDIVGKFKKERERQREIHTDRDTNRDREKDRGTGHTYSCSLFEA